VPEHEANPPMPDAAQWVRQIVGEYERPLMRYATGQLGGDIETAREVVQDTFLKLWQADRGAGADRIAPWLYTVCRNRALDVRRKERRMTTLGDTTARTVDETTQPQRRSDTHAPESGDAATEQHCRVQQAMDLLNDRQRDALRLKFQGGLSYREIAEVLDITVNHVGVLIHNAMKNIRTQLSAEGEQRIGSNATATR